MVKRTLGSCLAVANENWGTNYALDGNILYEGVDHICNIDGLQRIFIADDAIYLNFLGKGPVYLSENGGRRLRETRNGR